MNQESERERPTEFVIMDDSGKGARERPKPSRYVVDPSISRSGRGRNRRSLAEMNFSERLAEVAIPHLRTSDPPIKQRRDVVTGYMVHPGTLERMNLHELQKELLEVVRRIIEDKRAGDAIMRDARALLAEYTNAIRDYDYMTEKQIESKRNNTLDPFEITTRDLLGFHLMNELRMIPLPTNRHPVDLYEPPEHKRFKGEGLCNILPGSSRGRHNARIDLAHFSERLTMGLFGGLALIGPMLLMVLHKDLLTTLLTVRVSTILFAAALSVFTQLQGETVLASVAAYAAVLVVFVGTSS